MEFKQVIEVLIIIVEQQTEKHLRRHIAHVEYVVGAVSAPAEATIRMRCDSIKVHFTVSRINSIVCAKLSTNATHSSL